MNENDKKNTQYMKCSDFAPAVVFAYRRVDKIKRCLESLKNNHGYDRTEVYLFADGAKGERDSKDVDEVQNYLSNFSNEENKHKKTIHLRLSSINKGLANSIIDGVTEVIKQYKKVIVIEDDLILSPFFLDYMNGALKYYESDECIWSISAYTPPIKLPKTYKKDLYLSYRASSWGWATWKDRWDSVDWEVNSFQMVSGNKEMQRMFNRGGNDLFPMLVKQMNGEIDSWAIRWCFSQSMQNKNTVYPVSTLIYNDGADGSGTHHSIAININSTLVKGTPRLEVLDLDKRIAKRFYVFYSDTIWKKIKRNLTVKDMIKIAKRIYRKIFVR